MLAQITLPCPPSMNSIWRVGRRVGSKKSVVYLSGTYKNWLELVCLQIRQAKKIKLYPVKVFITVNAGNDWRRRDIDNIVKPTLDALVKFGCIEGDDSSKVDEVGIKFERKQQPKSTITITIVPTALYDS